jgi:hypothetical protein
MFNAKMKKENKCHPFSWKCYLPPKGNIFKCENRLVPKKCNKCIIANRYGHYLHIQIVLKTIYDAIFDLKNVNKDVNSVALVRGRTILTERPPFVDEVSANLCG